MKRTRRSVGPDEGEGRVLGRNGPWAPLLRVTHDESGNPGAVYQEDAGTEVPTPGAGGLTEGPEETPGEGRVRE